VFAEASTSSEQINTLTLRGAQSWCLPERGSAYELCGGGILWVRALGGYLPYACVEVYW
jgi:hypothetical protein